MKKILLILLITSIGCSKKQDIKPKDYSGQYKSGSVTITINSNYKYPYVRIQNGSTIYKRMNFSGLSDSTEIKYTFGSYPGEWTIYTTASKNGLDSTQNMKDGKILWESLKVETNGNIIYSSSDTIKPNTTETGVDNLFKFTVY